jgi:hypothetical protein
VAPAPAASATPSPAPSPAAATGAFVYGQRPAFLPPYAANQAPKVYYVSASPTVLHNGSTITLQAVTSSNVTRVVVQLGAVATALQQLGPGVWQATVPFALPSTSQMSPQGSAVLTATRADGVATTLGIPLTLLP